MERPKIPKAQSRLTQSEDRLRFSQAHLKAIIDTAVDGIISIDERGMVQSFNPAAEKLFGYRAEEIIGRTVNTLMPSPYREEHDGYIAKYVSTGTKKIIGIGREVVARRKDGTVFPVFLSVGEMWVGEARLFTGIIRDITALKKSEEDLRKANEELKQQVWVRQGQTVLAEKMRGELAVPELCQNILSFVCEYLEACVGAIYLEKDGILQRTATHAYTNIRDKQSFKLGEGLVGQAARDLKPLSLTNVPTDYIKVSSALGDTSPKHIVVYPIGYEGRASAVLELASMKGFTEQELAFLAAVTESIGIGIQTSKAKRIQELLEETQRQAAELESQSEELRSSNEELEEQTQALKDSEAKLQAQQEELEQINEELEERSKALEEQKEQLRKNNEELNLVQSRLLEQTRQLEISGKYKSEFLANMSHELRTPLNSILILAKLLFDNKHGNLTSEQIEFAETIHSSGTDLVNLINDILDLSKVEAGKLSLHPEKIDLKSIADLTIQTFRQIAESKELKFSSDVETDLSDEFTTDKVRLEQILRNFISNALKFTEKGEVKLRIYKPGAEELTSKKLKENNLIAFSVIDTGIGIPKDKLDIIFEAFCQVDGTTSRKYGGTGLGLTICRELASLLGGTISIDSKVGEGSTFSLYLPQAWSPKGKTSPSAKEEDVRSPTPKLPPRSIPKPQTVPDDRFTVTQQDKTLLIIEDDLRFSRALTTLGHDRGFKCVVAEDGEAGLELLSAVNPKAILLDIRLPGMDGFEVLERIKANPKTRHIPVHIISVSEERTDSLLQLGAIGFLRKPVDEKELENVFSKIESLLTKKVKRLLIVEDNQVQRESIVRLIGNSDVQTLAVGTAKEALESVQKERPDCIVMDIGLPDYSGFELLERIAKDKTLSPPPVIVYTGRDVSPDEEEKLRMYSQSIIIKGARSPERLLDEAMLFLHRVEEKLPKEKRDILVKLRDEAFEGKKVLLVDDDMRNVYALTKTLEDRGLSVVVGKDGKQALSRLEAEPDISLVVMDIMMPEMDGFTAMKEIRKLPRFKNLPIIALTAKAMKEDRAKCITAGANDYVAKPVDVDQLLTLLRVWLARRM